MNRTHHLFVVVVFAAASAAWAHGELHEAIEATSAAIVRAPDDAALWLRRAELRRKHGEWSAAESDYAKARALRPDLEIVALGLAQMRVAQGREGEALELADDFLAKSPAHADARLLRAGILEKRGDWKKADADLAAAVAASAEPHYATKRAALLERHGQSGAAVRCLDEASRARGGVPLLEQQALEIEERAGKTDAALRRLEDFIGREPRRDIWLARKARLLEKTGRAVEARDAWRKAGDAFEKLPANRRDSEANRKLGAEIRAGLAGSRGRGR